MRYGGLVILLGLFLSLAECGRTPTPVPRGSVEHGHEQNKSRGAGGLQGSSLAKTDRRAQQTIVPAKTNHNRTMVPGVAPTNDKAQLVKRNALLPNHDIHEKPNSDISAYDIEVHEIQQEQADEGVTMTSSAAQQHLGLMDDMAEIDLFPPTFSFSIDSIPASSTPITPPVWSTSTDIISVDDTNFAIDGDSTEIQPTLSSTTSLLSNVDEPSTISSRAAAPDTVSHLSSTTSSPSPDNGRGNLDDFYARYETTQAVDLVFVLDRSGSVPKKGWAAIVMFMKVCKIQLLCRTCHVY